MSANEAVEDVRPTALHFESRVKISLARAERLARQAIGAVELVPEPVRDVQLALKSIGVAGDVVLTRLESDTIYLTPREGVGLQRFNEVVRKIQRELGDRSVMVRAGLFAAGGIVVGAGAFWAAMALWQAY